MSEIDPERYSLTRAVADAIAAEERRDLGGDPPTGGHGYYGGAIVAVVATLRWFAVRGVMFNPDQLDAVADNLEDAARNEEWAYLIGGSRYGE